MSYRPDDTEDQALKPSIDKILEGIEEFNEAATKRIKSNDWLDSHRSELNIIRKQLMDIELKLAKLKKETW